MGYFKDIKAERFCETIVSLTNKKQKYADIFDRGRDFEMKNGVGNMSRKIENA